MIIERTLGKPMYSPQLGDFAPYNYPITLARPRFPLLPSWYRGYLPCYKGIVLGFRTYTRVLDPSLISTTALWLNLIGAYMRSGVGGGRGVSEATGYA